MKSFDCPHCHKVFESDAGGSEIVLCPHCNGTVSLPEKDLPPGTVMGGFEIIRLLGRGGMGNVYLAKQVSMERLVALKILLKSLTRDKESIEQFLNEARVSGRLNHPNVIPAIDAGEVDGTYYLATAYVDGNDLEHRLERDHSIPENEALQIAIKIAHALNYAWNSYGLLHKDIKPGNLMYDKKGEVFLMDMGIAQYIGEDSGGEDHVLGSPFFMSPEQTTASRLSWTSDLYSLGATLYNMIVGLPPYDAPDVTRIIEMHTTEPFPEPLSRNPTADISRPTVELMRKMMGKRPEDRFDSWQGFIEAAEAALKALDRKPGIKKDSNAVKHKTGRHQEPVQKRPGRTKQRVRVAHKQANPITSLLSYVLMLILAGGIAYVVYDHHTKSTASEAFNKAERFLADHPGEYDSIIDQFRQARQKCRGTEFESSVSERLNSIIKEQEEQIKLIKEFRDAKEQADRLVIKKQYDDAIKLIIDASKNIRDPSLLREADMKISLYKMMSEKNRN
jgi:serine/threonine-protein kinase